MLASERVADGEMAACNGRPEWTPEGELKGSISADRVSETENQLR